MTVQTIMSDHLVTVSSDITIADALVEMSRNRVHNMPVVDKDGCFVGLQPDHASKKNPTYPDAEL